MVVRLIAFLGAGVYLAATGELALAALSLLGLIPGLLGLVGAVVFAIALLVTGHWVLAILILVVVAVVFWLSNPQWRRSRQIGSLPSAPVEMRPRTLRELRQRQEKMTEAEWKSVVVGAHDVALKVREVAEDPGAANPELLAQFRAMGWEFPAPSHAVATGNAMSTLIWHVWNARVSEDGWTENTPMRRAAIGLQLWEMYRIEVSDSIIDKTLRAFSA